MSNSIVLAASIATVSGLVLDVIGFVLIFRYGHAYFIWFGSQPPSNKVGRDGDLHLQIPGINDRNYERKRRFAMWGLRLVITGFLAQIAGATTMLVVQVAL